MCKNIVAQSVIKNMRRSVLYLPARYRIKLLERILDSPLVTVRRMLGQASRPYGLQLSWIHRIKKESWSGTWIIPNLQKNPQPADWAEQMVPEYDLVIMYIHGGGFRVGSSDMYMASFTHIIERLDKIHGSRAAILSVEYTLAPEAAFPRARDECVDAYRYLVHSLGVDPRRIIVAGDSAGGNLTAVTLLHILQQREHASLKSLPPLPLPAGAVMISPWITLETTAPTYATNSATDYVQIRQLIDHMLDYLPELRTMDDQQRHEYICRPEISPLYANYEGFCPTLVTYGEAEAFQHDNERLVQRLQQQHVHVDVITRENAAHIWVIEPFAAPSEKIWLEDCSKMVDWCAATVKNARGF
ncbi:Alpha/Beta hydrolase protein [Radiomyces spectabilis]|uniref:Alpha/Beta hydrolase protein n=1 Tax=Radiomyces spectabilis TaxID=64574 RepID=UPI00221FCB55|nr:Alpha/Beta hydrolase protein [Radiomyces spectabilis]KAI8369564.1 Alpha/Beta hydrolase protein [Radiomyces spectabilis]